MKIAFQLAYKNLMNAKLRTSLNVAVLSFSFVVILFYNGMIDGWNNQAKQDAINWEFGYGQLQHEDYDTENPLSFQTAYGSLSTSAQENLCPVFVKQASIYPHNRIMNVLFKGIDIKKNNLNIPINALNQKENSGIPIVIGKRMAKDCQLSKGDIIKASWKDKNGTYDATSLYVADIFNSNVASIDNGQIWISLDDLQKMTLLNGMASYWVADENYNNDTPQGWKFISQEKLLEDLSRLIAMKKSSGAFIYLLLLFIALLAIFDTQVLSIFRRQKEIGTYIAMGMTKMQVTILFTIEGLMYSIMAIVAGALYGSPLLWYFAEKGIKLSAASQDSGVIIGEYIYPEYSISLILSTIFLILISSGIASYLPVRKINKMNPVEALKGKLQ